MGINKEMVMQNIFYSLIMLAVLFVFNIPTASAGFLDKHNAATEKLKQSSQAKSSGYPSRP